ncbi:MAG: saccharopine dehydrogenase NADP-binding domain-containing protein [Deltaproteobacteria bacterium]|nr:saccharopine dehydrogenase NADP-binding domain-containing protein [Deltaproteobacteria bacterium]
MSKVIVLGGVGAVGRVSVKTLAAHDAFDTVVVGDIDEKGADALCAEIGTGGLEAVHVDAGDVASVRRAIEGCDVVLNCTGPFYLFAKPVMEAVLDAGINYVDVCDDVDATLDLLEMDAAAQEAGISVLIGMGNSPGVTNLLGRFAADQLLDETESVDIFHAHGGEPFEGPGVVAHRLHGMTMDIPMFIDGELKTVHFFEPDGLALREKVDFHLIGKGVQVYPYPHPEQVTMPRYMNLKRVTNRGTVLPDEYFTLTTEVARMGLTSRESIPVGDGAVVPHDFAVAWLLQKRDEILKRMDFGTQRGCALIVARGIRHGLPRAYRFSMASVDQALGEGTGIPAAMGAILMEQGAITRKGVFPPEGGVEPLAFLALVQPVLALTQKGGSFEGVVVEKVDENGNVENVNLPF